MRIAHVVTLLSPDNAFGGPVRVALNQLAELSRRGHDVTLYAGWKGDRPPPPSIDGVPVRAFQVRRVVPGSRFAGLHAPGLHRTLRQDLPQLDAVHVHLARDLITLPAALTTLASDLPLFVQTHGMVVPSRRAILRAVDLLATRHVLRRASAVFYLTPTEREALAAVAGPDIALADLPNGVAVVEAPSTHRDSLEFLFLGRLHKTKRPEMFVRAASTVSRVLPNASFALVGPDGGEGASVKSLIAAAESTTRIRWEGALPIDRVPERLNEAAVLVLPSSYDPFPMSALEAMSAGIPTIVTEACGVADLVRTIDARLVVGDSQGELVDAMTWLASDPGLRDELGRRARAAVSATHSITVTVDRMEAILGQGTRPTHNQSTRPRGRVAILQPYVPEYRVRLFDELIQLLEADGIEARVFYGKSLASARRGDAAIPRPWWAQQVPSIAFHLPGTTHQLFARRLPRRYRRDSLIVAEMAAGNLDAYAALIRRRPVVTWGHGWSIEEFEPRISVYLETWLNRRAKHVLTYTDQGTDIVRQRTGLDANRVTTFRNSTDSPSVPITRLATSALMRKLGIPAGAFVATFVGTLGVEKRLDVLTLAATKVLGANPRAWLLVAGDGPQRELAEQLAARENRVILLGQVSRRDLPLLLSATDVIVNPGRVGLVAFDALSAGVPILTLADSRHAPEFSYLTTPDHVRSVEGTADDFAHEWANTATHVLAGETARFEPDTTHLPSIHTSADVISRVVISTITGTNQ